MNYQLLRRDFAEIQVGRVVERRVDVGAPWDVVREGENDYLARDREGGVGVAVVFIDGRWCLEVSQDGGWMVDIWTRTKGNNGWRRGIRGGVDGKAVDYLVSLLLPIDMAPGWRFGVRSPEGVFRVVDLRAEEVSEPVLPVVG